MAVLLLVVRGVRKHRWCKFGIPLDQRPQWQSMARLPPAGRMMRWKEHQKLRITVADREKLFVGDRVTVNMSRPQSVQSTRTIRNTPTSDPMAESHDAVLVG